VSSFQSVPAREDRYWSESGSDNRKTYQRDRDRVLYTSAFQRLAEVTQVLSPDEGHVFHNRLTHSLKVAQVGRRIAEMLQETQPQRSVEAGGIDPDVVETAALAHDLGHPPFGHIAEEELNDLMVNTAHIAEGFDGNAQSFRIVNRLALRNSEREGLNLTRASLQAILKYPWFRGSSGKQQRKWGVYSSEKEQFDFARALAPLADQVKSAEAEIMDWADDVTYAVHDAADFFRAGLIPLDRLADGGNGRERKKLYDEVFAREEFDYPRVELEGAFDQLRSFMPFTQPYLGTNSDRTNLKAFSAGLISRYVREGVELTGKFERDVRRLHINAAVEKEVIMLKQLTWHYVILNPALATQQHGQRCLIRKLFEIFIHAAAAPNRRTLFPFAFRDMLDHTSTAQEQARIVCDYIAGMTERQAFALHSKLTATQAGSALH
jgi:dGTPase